MSVRFCLLLAVPALAALAVLSSAKDVPLLAQLVYHHDDYARAMDVVIIRLRLRGIHL